MTFPNHSTAPRSDADPSRANTPPPAPIDMVPEERGMFGGPSKGNYPEENDPLTSVAPNLHEAADAVPRDISPRPEVAPPQTHLPTAASGPVPELISAGHRLVHVTAVPRVVQRPGDSNEVTAQRAEAARPNPDAIGQVLRRGGTVASVVSIPGSNRPATVVQSEAVCPSGSPRQELQTTSVPPAQQGDGIYWATLVRTPKPEEPTPTAQGQQVTGLDIDELGRRYGGPVEVVVQTVGCTPDVLQQARDDVWAARTDATKNDKPRAATLGQTEQRLANPDVGVTTVYVGARLDGLSAAVEATCDAMRDSGATWQPLGADSKDHTAISAHVTCRDAADAAAQEYAAQQTEYNTYGFGAFTTAAEVAELTRLPPNGTDGLRTCPPPTPAFDGKYHRVTEPTTPIAVGNVVRNGRVFGTETNETFTKDVNGHCATHAITIGATFSGKSVEISGEVAQCQMVGVRPIVINGTTAPGEMAATVARDLARKQGLTAEQRTVHNIHLGGTSDPSRVELATGHPTQSERQTKIIDRITEHLLAQSLVPGQADPGAVGALRTALTRGTELAVQRRHGGANPTVKEIVVATRDVLQADALGGEYGRNFPEWVRGTIEAGAIDITPEGPDRYPINWGLVVDSSAVPGVPVIDMEDVPERHRTTAMSSVMEAVVDHADSTLPQGLRVLIDEPGETLKEGQGPQLWNTARHNGVGLAVSMQFAHNRVHNAVVANSAIVIGRVPEPHTSLGPELTRLLCSRANITPEELTEILAGLEPGRRIRLDTDGIIEFQIPYDPSDPPQKPIVTDGRAFADIGPHARAYTVGELQAAERFANENPKTSAELLAYATDSVHAVSRNLGPVMVKPDSPLSKYVHRLQTEAESTDPQRAQNAKNELAGIQATLQTWIGDVVDATPTQRERLGGTEAGVRDLGRVATQNLLDPDPDRIAQEPFYDPANGLSYALAGHAYGSVHAAVEAAAGVPRHPDSKELAEQMGVESIRGENAQEQAFWAQERGLAHLDKAAGLAITTTPTTCTGDRREQIAAELTMCMGGAKTNPSPETFIKEMTDRGFTIPPEAAEVIRDIAASLPDLSEEKGWERIRLECQGHNDTTTMPAVRNKAIEELGERFGRDFCPKTIETTAQQHELISALDLDLCRRAGRETVALADIVGPPGLMANTEQGATPLDVISANLQEYADNRKGTTVVDAAKRRHAEQQTSRELGQLPTHLDATLYGAITRGGTEAVQFITTINAARAANVVHLTPGAGKVRGGDIRAYVESVVSEIVAITPAKKTADSKGSQDTGKEQAA